MRAIMVHFLSSEDNIISGKSDIIFVMRKSASALCKAGIDLETCMNQNVFRVIQPSRYNTLHFASQSSVPKGGFSPFGNPRFAEQPTI